MKTKIFITLLFISFLTLGFKTNLVKACDVQFEIVDGEKDTYSVGDVVIIKVKISFTHRVCSEGIKTTDFNTDGMEILSATDWVESETNVWTRKIKVKITETGKTELSATRTCDKEGGFGSIFLEAA